MIGVYILPKQSKLAGATSDKATGLFKNSCHRPREFSTARIGHNTKCTKFVTSFLYTQKCRWPARGMFARQKVEFYLFGKISINHPVTRHWIDLVDQFWQPMIGLWADNNIHPRGPAGNFCTFCLRHTTSHRDCHLPALLVTRPFFELA